MIRLRQKLHQQRGNSGAGRESREMTVSPSTEAAAEEALQRLQDERREREIPGAQAQRVDCGIQTEKGEVPQVAVLRAQLADKDETIRMLKESKKQLAGDLSSLECLARQVIA